MAFRAGVAAYIDSRDAKRGAEEFSRSVGQMVTDARTGTARIGLSFNSLKGEVLGVAAELGLAIGGAQLLRGVIETAASFDHLRKNLETVTGSATSAARAFEFIKEFAADAPGSIEDVTQAYIKLVQLGIDPTAGALEALGNLASVRNQNIAQAADTVVGAALGRAAQLKELGIVAEDSGKKLVLTFGTAQAEVDKNVSSMISGVIRLADGVKGAMGRADDSVEGASRSIGLEFRKLADEIGRAGVNDALKEFAKIVKDSVAGSTSFADAVGTTLASAIRGAGEAFQFARDHADEFRLIFEALLAREALLRIGQYGAVVIELAGAFRTLAVAQGAWGAVAAIANPALLIPVVVAGGTAALLYAQRQAEQRQAEARAMATPGVADIMSNKPVTQGARTLGPANVTEIVDATREKATRDATLAAQRAAEVTAAQAEADKKAAEAARQSAAEAAKAEATRQDAIRETLNILRLEAEMQQHVTDAVKGSRGLAEAQATGNVDAVNAIADATRRLTVEQDALKAAQQAGIKATLDSTGAVKALDSAEQPLVDSYRQQVRLASDAAEAAKRYQSAQEVVSQSIAAALTPAENYAKALGDIRKAFADNAEGTTFTPLEVRAFDKANLEAQKAALQQWKSQVMESTDTKDIGKKMFAGFDDEAKNFANDIAQYGIGSVHEFSSAIVDFASEGTNSFADFATAAVKELARILVQAELTKAALSALSFFGQGTPTPISGSAPAIFAPTASVGLPGGGAPPPIAYQTADATSLALQNQKLAAPSQSMKFDVNVVNSPSDKAPQVEMKQTPQGMEMRLVFEAAENFIADRAARGQGSIAPLLKAGGWNPRA